MTKRKAIEANGQSDKSDYKRLRNDGKFSSSTLSEDEMSNDLLSAAGKTADETYSQDAKVFHEREGSQKSDGSTSSGLAKNSTLHFFGRPPSTDDSLVPKKPGGPRVGDLSDSDEDNDYGQFVGFFEA